MIFLHKNNIPPTHSNHVRSLSHRLFPYLVFLALTFPSAARASEIIPLYGFNQSPVIGIFGLPTLDPARVLDKNETAFSIRGQISNNYSGAVNATERLIFDGETHRLILVVRQGMGSGREWAMELPYFSHNGGFLDSSVERFHDTFGFKQGGRTDVPRDRIDYRFTRKGENLFRVNRPVSGVGDLRLAGAVQLRREAAQNGYDVALRGSLKLPTGDSAYLFGSGSTDLAMWLSIAREARPKTWKGYGGVGLLLMGQGDVLPSQQHRYVGFGTLGFARKFSSRLTFNAQLDAHTPFYDGTSFRQFNAYAAQGLVGLVWEFAPKTYFEFSVAEDVVVNTSPDAVFQISVTLPF